MPSFGGDFGIVLLGSRASRRVIWSGRKGRAERDLPHHPCRVGLEDSAHHWAVGEPRRLGPPYLAPSAFQVRDRVSLRLPFYRYYIYGARDAIAFPCAEAIVGRLDRRKNSAQARRR